MNYPVLRLKKGREKSAIKFHPWIFSGAVDKMDQAKNGEIISVQTSDNQVVGYGFYDKNSQIVCRIFHFDEAPQDFYSKPFWKNKLDKALVLRKSFVISDDTNCYRLVHAEGDGMSGLIVDIYHDVAVIQFLIGGMLNLKAVIVECLQELGYQKIYVKNEPGNTKGYWEIGVQEGLIQIKENSIAYVVDVEHGQKTGFFIDQRENRRIASELSAGKRVLNLFSYSGGFSVAAFKGGATRVASVDVSASAMELCKNVVNMNFPETDHQAIEEDCFQYLRNMEETFDIIIIDPPAFAKNQASVNKAARGYKDLSMIAIKKVASPGLILTFSCSQHITKDLFQKIVFAAAADSGRNVKILKRLEQPEDHPVNIYHPEGDYLKGLLLYVE